MVYYTTEGFFSQLSLRIRGRPFVSSLEVSLFETVARLPPLPLFPAVLSVFGMGGCSFSCGWGEGTLVLHMLAD